MLHQETQSPAIYFDAEARLQAKHTLSGSGLSQRTMHRSSYNGADQSIPAHCICFICHEIMREWAWSGHKTAY